MINRNFKYLKKIHFETFGDQWIVPLLQEASNFEYVEEVEIFCKENDFFRFGCRSSICIPRTMGNVEKVLICSDSSELLSYVKDFVPKNISYELQFCHCLKF